MERSALHGIADERTLLLPLVSAQNFEAPVLAAIAIAHDRSGFGGKVISNSNEISS
jgi:hypothetical protein